MGSIGALATLGCTAEAAKRAKIIGYASDKSRLVRTRGASWVDGCAPLAAWRVLAPGGSGNARHLTLVSDAAVARRDKRPAARANRPAGFHLFVRARQAAAQKRTGERLRVAAAQRRPIAIANKTSSVRAR